MPTRSREIASHRDAEAQRGISKGPSQGVPYGFFVASCLHRRFWLAAFRQTLF